jgi:hypothetical protein
MGMGIFKRDKPYKKGKQKAPEAPKERTVGDCIKIVEGFLEKNGMNPSEHRLPSQGAHSWWVVRGSALIYIYLIQHENHATLRMVSPILYFPEERVVALYRKCLEINMELLNCALGVYQDTVAVVSERPTSGLDTIEFAGTLDYLSAVADDLDDKLAIEFGAKLYGGIRASA